jgi:hypothetical protein
MVKELGGVRVVPNILAPDVFADDVIAVETVNGTVRITLAVAKLDDATEPSPLSLVTVGRIVMGEKSAQRLAVSLVGYFSSRGISLTTATDHKTN